MYLKPANSDMEMAFKNFKNVPCKYSYTAGTGNWNIHFLKGTRITWPWGWITSHKKNLYTAFHFNTSRFFEEKKIKILSCRGSDPPPLSGMSS